MSRPEEARGNHQALILTALGVVFGDIGTSPLYAVRETFNPNHGIALSVENVVGGISAIIWALVLVVSVKYVALILRADNRGEGGIMALMALVLNALKQKPRWYAAVLMLGMFGAALFYGDAVLTPAISVLSAVEGLKVGTSVLHPFIIPISLGVLLILFMLESHGTHVVGMFFGPVMLLWFSALAVGGLINVVRHPAILAALNPLHGLLFVTTHGLASFVVLGSVLLAFTGAEALYADMGHFGQRPIRIAWFRLVFPALSLNYLGQGGVLLDDFHHLANPFYLLFPHWALYPMVILATMATVIASQATISGAYSLTKQAVQLRLMPRFNVAHTSERETGQVYLPAINWALLALVSATVILFGSSTHLAAAYGLSVTGTMLVTTFLMYFVFRFVWGKGQLLSLAVCGFFCCIDLAFFSSSLLKVFSGAWFPLAIGAVVFIIMRNWWHGRQILVRRIRNTGISFRDFVHSLDYGMPHRVSGTAIYLSADPDRTPDALLHNMKHNKILHSRVICLHVDLMEIPWVTESERMSVESFGHDCWHIVIHFGFKEQPDVVKGLIEQASEHGLDFNILHTTFFLSRITLVPVTTRSDGMALWREKMFAAMARNMFSAVAYFNIPTNRAIELGTRIEL